MTGPHIPKSVEEIQKLEIDPEEILYLVERMTALHDENDDVDWYTAMAVLAGRYEKDAVRMFCISERMACLSALVKDERMRGWSFQAAEPDCIITNTAVFDATARCTMKADEKHVWFDPDEFFQLILKESDSEGTA